jgi:hypothetical protein
MMIRGYDLGGGVLMTREESEREVALNRRVYEALREQIRRDYAGQYVALGQGRILAVAPTFDEADAAVARLQPVPEVYWVFAAAAEPSFEPVCDYFYPRTEGPGMDHDVYERAVALNRPVYESLRDQIRRDYAGQYVALGGGRILAVAAGFEEAEAAVEAMEPVPEVYWIFAADREFDFGQCIEFA